jgi:hypothetical protein
MRRVRLHRRRRAKHTILRLLRNRFVREPGSKLHSDRVLSQKGGTGMILIELADGVTTDEIKGQNQGGLQGGSPTGGHCVRNVPTLSAPVDIRSPR